MNGGYFPPASNHKRMSRAYERVKEAEMLLANKIKRVAGSDNNLTGCYIENVRASNGLNVFVAQLLIYCSSGGTFCPMCGSFVPTCQDHCHNFSHLDTSHLYRGRHKQNGCFECHCSLLCNDCNFRIVGLTESARSFLYDPVARGYLKAWKIMLAKRKREISKVCLEERITPRRCAP